MDIYLHKIAPNSTTPLNIVFEKFEKNFIHDDLVANVYWRFADESPDLFRFLGQATKDNNLQVPIELQGKEIVLSLIAQNGENLTTSDPRTGVLQNFIPAGKAFLEYDIKEAAVALTQGDLVNIYDAGGFTRVRIADAVSAYEAHGWIDKDYEIGDEVRVFFGGVNRFVSGLDEGKAFLSESTSGFAGSDAPISSGSIVQQVGVAISATELYFNPQEFYKLA